LVDGRKFQIGRTRLAGPYPWIQQKPVFAVRRTQRRKKNRALLIPRARGGFVESSCDGLRVVFISIAKAPCQAFAAIFFFAARVLLVFPAEHCKRRANSGAGFDASGEKPEKNAER
jgi:hypothetical protein